MICAKCRQILNSSYDITVLGRQLCSKCEKKWLVNNKIKFDKWLVKDDCVEVECITATTPYLFTLKHQLFDEISGGILRIQNKCQDDVFERFKEMDRRIDTLEQQRLELLKLHGISVFKGNDD